MERGSWCQLTKEKEKRKRDVAGWLGGRALVLAVLPIWEVAGLVLGDLVASSFSTVVVLYVWKSSASPNADMAKSF